MKTFNFQLDLPLKSRLSPYPPLLHFLRAVKSFYRRYVSCMYNMSNMPNKYAIYQLYSLNLNFFRLAGRSQHYSGTPICLLRKGLLVIDGATPRRSKSGHSFEASAPVDYHSARSFGRTRGGVVICFSWLA